MFTVDAWFGSDAEHPERGVRGRKGLRSVIEAVRPYHPHHTTNVVLTHAPDGSLRAWSKFLIVRTDGTAGSGDYLDTLVSTPAGWRIAHREVSRGHRGSGDPGGASERTFTTQRWRSGTRWSARTGPWPERRSPPPPPG